MDILSLQHPCKKEAGGGKGTGRTDHSTPCSPWVESDMSPIPIIKQAKCFPILLPLISSPGGTPTRARPRCQPSWRADDPGSRETPGQDEQKSALPHGKVLLIWVQNPNKAAFMHCCASAYGVSAEKACPHCGNQLCGHIPTSAAGEELNELAGDLRDINQGTEGRALQALGEGKCCREWPRHKSDWSDDGMEIYPSCKGETCLP